MFKKLSEYLSKQTLLLDAQLAACHREKLRWNERELWDLDTGRKFNDLVSKYPISEYELLGMSETLCEFVQQTRLTNIEEYLFVDGDRSKPRLPHTLRHEDCAYCGNGTIYRRNNYCEVCGRRLY